VEPAALKRLAGRAVVAAAVVGGALLLWWRMAGSDAVGARPRPIVPEGVRIKVEVLNATKTRGLARRATFALRDAGFDVVRFTSDTTQRDTTLVLDRSGHEAWARLVVRALGTGRVESRPDSSRYLDVTVLLGADWRPPAKPFYP
jgi:hypothetical protein